MRSYFQKRQLGILKNDRFFKIIQDKGSFQKAAFVYLIFTNLKIRYENLRFAFFKETDRQQYSNLSETADNKKHPYFIANQNYI